MDRKVGYHSIQQGLRDVIAEALDRDIKNLLTKSESSVKENRKNVLHPEVLIAIMPSIFVYSLADATIRRVSMEYTEM